MRKWLTLLFLFCVLTGGVGCSPSTMARPSTDEDWMTLPDLEYEIVDGSEVPQKVHERIFHKQKERFGFTYQDGDSQYMALGYGVVPTSGYQIQILAVKEDAARIIVAADLIAPQPEQVIRHTETYPSMILKIANTEKQVQFRLSEE